MDSANCVGEFTRHLRRRDRDRIQELTDLGPTLLSQGFIYQASSAHDPGSAFGGDLRLQRTQILIEGRVRAGKDRTAFWVQRNVFAFSPARDLIHERLDLALFHGFTLVTVTPSTSAVCGA